MPTAKEYQNKGTPFVATRTRFFDDFLMSVAHQRSQVVILGAGMDTRAFRLTWHPDTHLYEVDQPEVLQFKESLLENSQALCNRHSLSINLKEPWSDLLIAQGYQIDIPSVWLLEGVFYYFSENEVHDLLKTITNLSAPTSCLGADLINTKLILQTGDGLSKYWRYGCEEPETLFANYGWKASVVQPGDEQAHFGRYTSKFPPRDVPDVGRIFFVTALKE
ncbi:class I SAM-dependent methyltransferase [Nostoc sp.]|uniref:class I SAM-dependent methyltransferase n=1 Tax=Nostoc sp. TaxID=1180 RepID=UPI002FF7E078